jgi:hypothetical protein
MTEAHLKTKADSEDLDWAAMMLAGVACSRDESAGAPATLERLAT